jgi:prepilin-type N-terminal cleavage/methylation domain-containing protein
MPIARRHAIADAPGFTLIEVLVTIMLVGVLWAIAATNFGAFLPGWRARGAALSVAGDLNQARLAAVKEARRYYFVPVSGTTYQIRADDDLGNVVTLKTVNAAADYTGVQFAATGVANDPYGNPIGGGVPAGQMVFNSDGTISNAGSIFVEPNSGDATHPHGVVATAAGRIRVWYWNGTTWN